MYKMQFFQDLVPSFAFSKWTETLVKKHILKEETENLESLCSMMMASDGEYSSLILGERILAAFELLNEGERLEFFCLLLVDYDINVDQVKTTLEDYAQNPDAENLLNVTRSAEPLRQELLRRINLTPQGTRRLVKMREYLLEATRKNPELKKIDTDFHHLFNAWFNRGFLVMQPIDWTTPAHILEKIIAYEAVHEIKSWSELRSRLEPSDRYCYGFFHPSMDDEPLVFVEVALTKEVPSSIGEILSRDTNEDQPENPSCAIFYSISNCHRGLKGVSFGNFLIKQVATNLKLHFPQLKTFATISPVPGLHKWLKTQAIEDVGITSLISNFDEQADHDKHNQLEKFAAQYFLEQKNKDNQPLDPVARFHLKNGAHLERINILANDSDIAMKQSLGTMVNYVYDLSQVEHNHEEYMKNNNVIASSHIKKLIYKS